MTVSAAETVLHGGPSVLVGASDPATIRAAGAYSLLETTASQGWQLGVALERALRRRVADDRHVARPHAAAADRDAARLSVRGRSRSSGSSARRCGTSSARCPGSVRRRTLQTIPASRGISAAFSGPPSVAHAEALLRGTEERARSLGEPLDALCLGIPGTTPYLPRERPNPLLAAYLGLGLALRLWRDAFPVVDGGTAILVHPFERRFAHPSQQPYRDFFRAIRAGIGA